MPSERWNIIENSSLPSTSLYDYFHSLSIQLMRMMRQQPRYIATYDIQGLGIQQVATIEIYGLYPPVTVNYRKDFNCIENRDSSFRLRIIDWDHRDRRHGTVEAMWSGDLSCDQILELLEDHRINLIWHHIFTNDSDYQDEDYSSAIEEEEEVHEVHDNQEIERVSNDPRENNDHPFITINLTSQSEHELEIILFDLGETGELENHRRGAPPAIKSAVDGLSTVAVCQHEVESGASLCVICREMVCLGEPARQLPCKHMYHSHCILQWLSLRNSCPTCRYELPTDSSHYEYGAY